uniref:Uncharacterized protein n=1 Tax=Graphocephala atropunctata TaxID=36148 RepID=A0A1B6LSS1_9HEMI
MANRGRGGGGRGRGRASLSFNVEQLGLAPGELLPGPVLQPPPLFPPLEFKPSPLLNDPFYEGQLELKSNFLEYFNKSSAFVRLKLLQPQVGQFSDAEQSKKPEKPFIIDWSCVPPELKPNLNKRKRKSGTQNAGLPKKIEKKNIANLTSWLEELEKKETVEEGKEKDTDDTEKKKEEDEQEVGEGEEFEEDDLDEEMDDGTDYNQNYFDNGEGYLDEEDDNLDDGPIY